LDVLIHLARLADGSRKVTRFQEITGMEGNIITLQEINSFEQTGIGNDGKVKGKFRIHGVRPKFLDRFDAFGIVVPKDLFDPTKVFEV
jgi:pilus assembly protein CpaF